MQSDEMETHIVYTEERYLSIIKDENLCDKKVLFVWPDTDEYKKGKCGRCHKQPCIGRMSVRKDIHSQYGMEVCKECFDKEK